MEGHLKVKCKKQEEIFLIQTLAIFVQVSIGNSNRSLNPYFQPSTVSKLKRRTHDCPNNKCYYLFRSNGYLPGLPIKGKANNQGKVSFFSSRNNERPITILSWPATG